MGPFVMRHEHLAGTLVELMQIGKTSSGPDGILHHPLRQQVQKGPAVCVIGVDGGLSISTAGHMIDGTGKSYAQWATHGDMRADTN